MNFARHSQFRLGLLRVLAVVDLEVRTARHNRLVTGVERAAVDALAAQTHRVAGVQQQLRQLVAEAHGRRADGSRRIVVGRDSLLAVGEAKASDQTAQLLFVEMVRPRPERLGRCSGGLGLGELN